MATTTALRPFNFQCSLLLTHFPISALSCLTYIFVRSLARFIWGWSVFRCWKARQRCFLSTTEAFTTPWLCSCSYLGGRRDVNLGLWQPSVGVPGFTYTVMHQSSIWPGQFHFALCQRIIQFSRSWLYRRAMHVQESLLEQWQNKTKRQQREQIMTVWEYR